MDQSNEHKAGPATPLTPHTPGPWRVFEAGGFWIVPAAPVSGLDELAQEFAGPDITIVPVPLDSEANARLIAAAPDLLAALKALMAAADATEHTQYSVIRITPETATALDALIAKAEGRDAG